jgi:hypothetical protein
MTVKIKSKQKSVWPRIIVGIVVALALVGGGLYIWHRHVHKTATLTSTSRNEYSKPEANSNVPGGSVSTSQGGAISSNKGSSATSTPTTPPSAQPIDPTGDFVSSHSITLTGTELSACTTTAGVQCQITFTLGGTTKSLASQTTNGNGSTSWNWTPQSIGLTPGSWKVTAVATNGSKTASTVDVNNLVVN